MDVVVFVRSNVSDALDKCKMQIQWILLLWALAQQSPYIVNVKLNKTWVVHIRLGHYHKPFLAWYAIICISNSTSLSPFPLSKVKKFIPPAGFLQMCIVWVVFYWLTVIRVCSRLCLREEGRRLPAKAAGCRWIKACVYGERTVKCTTWRQSLGLVLLFLNTHFKSLILVIKVWTCGPRENPLQPKENVIAGQNWEGEL